MRPGQPSGPGRSTFAVGLTSFVERVLVTSFHATWLGEDRYSLSPTAPWSISHFAPDGIVPFWLSLSTWPANCVWVWLGSAVSICWQVPLKNATLVCAGSGDEVSGVNVTDSTLPAYLL